jgi:hypothetical protein
MREFEVTMCAWNQLVSHQKKHCCKGMPEIALNMTSSDTCVGLKEDTLR